MASRKQEIREAIEAGHYALEALDEAAGKLDSAKRWGIWDILGGGFFSSLIKHGRIEEARDALDDARQALWRFGQEAADVRELVTLDVDLSQLNSFFDVAFDNALADIFTQQRLSEASERVDEARRRVRRALDRLERLQ